MDEYEKADYDYDFDVFCDGTDDEGEFELLPDHECPWATAMWRDAFG